MTPKHLDGDLKALASFNSTIYKLTDEFFNFCVSKFPATQTTTKSKVKLSKNIQEDIHKHERKPIEVIKVQNDERIFLSPAGMKLTTL